MVDSLVLVATPATRKFSITMHGALLFSDGISRLRRTLTGISAAAVVAGIGAITLAAPAPAPKSGAKTSTPSFQSAPVATRKTPPTLANVAYGSHPRQVLDFWKVDSTRPTPLLLFIHGGGWVSSDKQDAHGYGSLARYLKAGISVVSINYRYTTLAHQAGVMPPVQWPLQDAARALQFVRSKAAEWNIDKARTFSSEGGSCTR